MAAGTLAPSGFLVKLLVEGFLAALSSLAAADVEGLPVLILLTADLGLGLDLEEPLVYQIVNIDS